MLQIRYKSSFIHEIGFQNERKSKRFPTFPTFWANHSSLSAIHPYLPHSKNVPTLFRKTSGRFSKNLGTFLKKPLVAFRKTPLQNLRREPHKGEKKHYSMDISSFFFVYVDFLLYLCISYN